MHGYTSVPDNKYASVNYIDSDSTTMITHQASPQAVEDTGWQHQIQHLQVASVRQVCLGCVYITPQSAPTHIGHFLY